MEKKNEKTNELLINFKNILETKKEKRKNKSERKKIKGNNKSKLKKNKSSITDNEIKKEKKEQEINLDYKEFKIKIKKLNQYI